MLFLKATAPTQRRKSNASKKLANVIYKTRMLCCARFYFIKHTKKLFSIIMLDVRVDMAFLCLLYFESDAGIPHSARDLALLRYTSYVTFAHVFLKL